MNDIPMQRQSVPTSTTFYSYGCIFTAKVRQSEGNTKLFKCVLKILSNLGVFSEIFA